MMIPENETMIPKNSLPPSAVRTVVCLLVLNASASWLLGAAEKHQTDNDITRLFTKTEAMIPMRDGVKLHTEILAPKKSRQPLPFIFTRTPYGITDEKGHNGYFEGLFKELINEGYIFVFQDIRGRYQSEGQFVMFRPPRGRNETIDEGTDTYDTIEWLLKNVANNNGRVGILGVSYGGWLTTMAILEPHPALKAASEQASPADQFLGDDFHHNGAFRLSYRGGADRGNDRQRSQPIFNVGGNTGTQRVGAHCEYVVHRHMHDV
jgi:putative CocE/NonD family hydrolase